MVIQQTVVTFIRQLTHRSIKQSDQTRDSVLDITADIDADEINTSCHPSLIVKHVSFLKLQDKECIISNLSRRELESRTESIEERSRSNVGQGLDHVS